MAKRTINISSILGGIAPSLYLGGANQFLDSVSVDPDLPVDDSGISTIRTSGVLVPTRYGDFSSTNLTAAPLWITTNPKDTNTYVYAANGRMVSYSSALTSGSEALAFTAATSTGNGAAYYNNYLYYASNTDVGRYGPLDGSPAKDDDAWTTSVLGTQTALTDTTYPSFNSIEMPNHPMFKHVDNRLYFGDVIGTGDDQGKGTIHMIRTRKGSDEGDTNNGSTAEVLKLPFGFKPTCIGSYGTDLVIGAIQTTDSTINQGNAALFFWDTFSTNYYRQVTLPDPFVTALLNNNGVLYTWSGNNVDGVRISSYIGGDSIKQIGYLEEGFPPFAGAVDAVGNRISWGANKTNPSTAACVYSIGSKTNLPEGMNNIAITSSSGDNPATYSLSYVEQTDNKSPRMIIGWKDDSNVGVDKVSTTETFKAIWRSRLYNVGKRFVVRQLRLPLGAAVAANMTLTPKVYVDDASASTTLTVINNTNYASSERFVRLIPNVTGNNNFFVELAWTGTASLPVTLPISVDIEELDP